MIYKGMVAFSLVFEIFQSACSQILRDFGSNVLQYIELNQFIPTFIMSASSAHLNNTIY